MLDGTLRYRILEAQKNEISEHLVYKRLSAAMKDDKNRKVLDRIADDELKHYEFWKKQTDQDVRPSNLKVWFIYLLARILGITFAVKLMERGEKSAQITYEEIADTIPEAKKVVSDEEKHENELLAMIDEERLKYVGSMVLGLNDALVELTGALAGLTFALQNAKLVAATGLVTGIAAAFSMAASEYLSTRAEEGDKHPVKAAVYTGIAYIITVSFLILPFLVVPFVAPALAWTLLNAVVVILAFTFYISVAKDLPFKKHFAEMAGISLGVAVLSFVIGYIVRIAFGFDV